MIAESKLVKRFQVYNPPNQLPVLKPCKSQAYVLLMLVQHRDVYNNIAKQNPVTFPPRAETKLAVGARGRGGRESGAGGSGRWRRLRRISDLEYDDEGDKDQFFATS